MFKLVFLFPLMMLLAKGILQFPLEFKEVIEVDGVSFNLHVYRSRLQGNANLTFLLDNGQLILNITTQMPLNLTNCYWTYDNGLEFVYTQEGPDANDAPLGCGYPWTVSAGVCKKQPYTQGAQGSDPQKPLYWFGYSQSVDGALEAPNAYHYRVCQCFKGPASFQMLYTLNFDNGSSLTGNLSKYDDSNQYEFDGEIFGRFFTLTSAPRDSYDWCLDRVDGTLKTGLVNGKTEFQHSKYGLVKVGDERYSIFMSGLLSGVTAAVSGLEGQAADRKNFPHTDYNPSNILPYLQSETLKFWGPNITVPPQFNTHDSFDVYDCSETIITKILFSNIDNHAPGIRLNDSQLVYFWEISNHTPTDPIPSEGSSTKPYGNCLIVVYNGVNQLPLFYEKSEVNTYSNNSDWYEFTLGIEATIINNLTDYNTTCFRINNTYFAFTNHPGNCLINGTTSFQPDGKFSVIGTDSLFISCDDGTITVCEDFWPHGSFTLPPILKAATPLPRKVSHKELVEIIVCTVCLLLLSLTVFLFCTFSPQKFWHKKKKEKK